MIKILNFTPTPISHIGKMAGLCYSSDTETPEKNYKRGLECIKTNHNRTFEYVDVIMEISGYSNRVIRELYTHIIGVTRLQESTRYVNMEKRFDEYYIPPAIAKNPKALECYQDTMYMLKDSYEFLLEQGIKKEDAGNIVPLGQHTKVILKINLEAIFHMFSNRTCTRAYIEFRQLMNEMRGELMALDSEWEALAKEYCVTKCVKTGYCLESKTCGRYPDKDNVQLVAKMGIPEPVVYPTPKLPYVQPQPFRATDLPDDYKMPTGKMWEDGKINEIKIGDMLITNATDGVKVTLTDHIRSDEEILKSVLKGVEKELYNINKMMRGQRE